MSGWVASLSRELADKLAAAIPGTAKAGQIGDGNTLVSPVERKVRVERLTQLQFGVLVGAEEADNGVQVTVAYESLGLRR